MRKDKVKDMIRSVLPSTGRRGARFFKAANSRSVRHAVRVDVVHQDFDETKVDLERSADQHSVVQDRRWDDKLNHFMRWCDEITRGMTTQEALDYVRAILPRNLIGDHAYTHWEAHRRPFHDWMWRSVPPEKIRQSFIDSMRCRLRRALDADPDLHARINAEIKRRHGADEQPRRLLAGLHDVNDFVLAIAPPERWKEDPFPLERAVTQELVKGGRKAALRICGASAYAQAISAAMAIEAMTSPR